MVIKIEPLIIKRIPTRDEIIRQLISSLIPPLESYDRGKYLVAKVWCNKNCQVIAAIPKMIIRTLNFSL